MNLWVRIDCLAFLNCLAFLHAGPDSVQSLLSPLQFTVMGLFLACVFAVKRAYVQVGAPPERFFLACVIAIKRAYVQVGAACPLSASSWRACLRSRGRTCRWVLPAP